MKKKIALLLAAVMVVGALPMTAFAATDNTVSAIKTVKNDKAFSVNVIIDEFEGIVNDTEEQVIKLELTNAKWDSAPEVETSGDVNSDATFQKVDDYTGYLTFDANKDSKVVNKLNLKSDGVGDATVTISPVGDTVVSAETLKIANVAGGATTTTISKTTSLKEGTTEIKTIVIEETTAGSLKAGKDLKLRLTNDFKWVGTPTITVFPATAAGGVGLGTWTPSADRQEATITVNSASTTASTISISGLAVEYDSDDIESGTECEVTVSGAEATKESIVVGTAADFGLTLKVEDKELPVFYSGRTTDKETLKVTIKENIADSWIDGRKAKLVFPEGVEVVACTPKKTSEFTPTLTPDENEVSISGTTNSKAFEVAYVFELAISPEFEGDITATLTGAAVGEDQTVTVGEAKFPVTVDADVNELKIDYRNTAASDIVITEADAGVLKKGEYVALDLEYLSFDGTPTVEVESGDIKVEDVKLRDGALTFKVKTESQKEAGVIRISDIELYMQRAIPAGEYDLSFVLNAGTVDKTNNAIFRNYDNNDDLTGKFDCDEVVAKDAYITVVTAGREQDDSTFTTKVTVTIGASTMMAGTKEIALDVPAYIANGYTMLPVRAVTEALSDAAIVRWDDATKTVTITFGQRVINMTVGSKTMVINGVNVAMQAACEITDSRAFIPLRDLGYALGLNDSKIAWDDATKTATLN